MDCWGMDELLYSTRTGVCLAHLACCKDRVLLLMEVQVGRRHKTRGDVEAEAQSIQAQCHSAAAEEEDMADDQGDLVALDIHSLTAVELVVSHWLVFANCGGHCILHRQNLLSSNFDLESSLADVTQANPSQWTQKLTLRMQFIALLLSPPTGHTTRLSSIAEDSLSFPPISLHGL